MKKVGICACYNSRNYGSMLQAYATQVVINSMGFESEYIVYKKKKNLKYLINQIPRLFNANLMQDKMLHFTKRFKLIGHPDIQKRLLLRELAFQKFKSQYYKSFSPEYYGYEELSNSAKNYDTVLVGSDQLWTPGGLSTNFYNLMFVPDNINKVSYATSFGVDKIPKHQYKKTKEYLSRINYLSVREKKGAELINNIANLNAKVVADPTMLLTKEEWNNTMPNKDLVRGSYIFCYFLGDNVNHRKVSLELKQKTGLKIVSIPFLDTYVKGDESFGDEQLYDIGPDGFVSLIRNADYILTDSFHGTVFSLLFEKKFVIFNRYSEDSSNSRNSRIDSLCSLLGIEGRRYSGDIYSTALSDIDYSMVHGKLSELRDKSKEFLKNALENNQ